MRATILCVFLLVACGDDGPNQLPDAPLVADAAIDTAVVADAPPDAAPVVLTSTVSFPSGLAGGLCGGGFDRSTSTIWLYPCSGADLHSFSVAGVAGVTVPRSGESTNDVDISFTSEAIVLGTNTIAANTMIFINGETGGAELHLPQVGGSTPLATPFGSSHVVGGSDHPQRDTVFVVQDQNGAQANTVAEIDRVSGVVINSFSTLPGFNVNFGDLEVCPETGNLFLVSNTETTLAEFTPTGTLIDTYALPVTVTGLSGLALGLAGQAWVTSTDGTVLRIDGVPCGF